MILTTHAVVGAALAQHTDSYTLAFAIGLLSHYVTDAIPHWHYPVLAIKARSRVSFSKNLLIDIFRVGVDMLIGIAIVSLFFHPANIISAFAVLGAVLPDFLSGFQKLWPTRVGTLHSKFHFWIHSNTDIDHKPLIGIGSQLAIIILAILL